MNSGELLSNLLMLDSVWIAIPRAVVVVIVW